MKWSLQRLPNVNWTLVVFLCLTNWLVTGGLQAQQGEAETKTQLKMGSGNNVSEELHVEELSATEVSTLYRVWIELLNDETVQQARDLGLAKASPGAREYEIPDVIVSALDLAGVQISILGGTTVYSFGQIDTKDGRTAQRDPELGSGDPIIVKSSGDFSIGSGTVNDSIQDQGFSWRWVQVGSSSAAPAGSTTTNLQYRTRIHNDSNPSNIYCGDYEVYLSSTARGGATPHFLVYNNLGGRTDGGFDDDSADDSDIYLNWRGTSHFNGEDPNQRWYIYVRDTLAGDDGFLQYIEFRVFWTSSGGNNPPTAPTISNSPSTTTVGQTTSVTVWRGTDPDGDQVKVQCTASNSNRTDANPYISSFTTGGSSTTATFVFNATGTQTIWCASFDPSGTPSLTSSRTISVQNTNQAPTAPTISNSPSMATTGQTTSVTVWRGTDPDGDQVKVECTASNSNRTDASKYISSFATGGSSTTATFIFNSAGTQTIWCTSFDPTGTPASLTSNRTISVQNANQAPTAPTISNSPSTTTAGQTTSVTVWRGTDPDGDQVKVECTASNSNRTDASKYISSFATGGSSTTATFTFNSAGTQTIWCTSFDPTGTPASLTSNRTISVQNANQAPTAPTISNSPSTTTAGQTTSVTVWRGTDPDGDQVKVECTASNSNRTDASKYISSFATGGSSTTATFIFNSAGTQTIWCTSFDPTGTPASLTSNRSISVEDGDPDIRIEPLTLNFAGSQNTFASESQHGKGFQTSSAFTENGDELGSGGRFTQQGPGVSVKIAAADLGAVAHGLPKGAILKIEDIDLTPGSGDVLELQRVEVFSPNAKIVAHRQDGEEILPVPRNSYFRGQIQGESRSLAMLTFFAEGGARGLVASKGRYWILGEGDAFKAGPGMKIREVDADSELAALAAGFSCDVSDVEDPLAIVAETFDTPKWSISTKMNTSHTVRVAIETDWEFYQIFGNDNDTVNYIGDVIAFTSGIYDAEVNTDMTISHISLQANNNDPWNEVDTGCALREFGRNWNDSNAGVDRTIAHFFSGKNNGGGVAWLGVLCSGGFNHDHQGDCPNLIPQSDNYGGAYGYSGDLDGNFDIVNPGVVWDIVVVAHEIGHNFNSPHTHCYAGIGGDANPIDQCSAVQCGQGGCYCGNTSLPCANAGAGCGTIMSYCHQLGGGLGNISLTLGTGHPFGVDPGRVPTRMSDHVVDRAAADPACLARGNSQVFTIFNEGGSDLTVSSIAPETPAAWISWSPAAPFDVAPGDSQQVSVSVDFSSAPAGQSTRRLLVSSNDPDESPYPGGVFVVVDNASTCFDLTRTLTGNGTQPSASPSAAGCPAGQYAEGEQIQLDASPDPGWTVERWTGTDNDASTATSNTATMPNGPHEVTVHYVESSPTCFALARTFTGNGTQPSAAPSTTGCAAGQYAAGEQIQLEASPDPSWTIDRWTGTDNDASTATSNTATMPNGSHEVTVHYVESSPTCFDLARTFTGNGTQPSASPSTAGCSAGQYAAGEQVQLEASPDPGWTVDRWTGTDNDASTATSNTATMPNGVHEVTVHYVESGPTCFDLVRTFTGNGTQPSASPSTAGCPAGQYAAGEQIQLEASPDPGWTVDRWTGTDNDASTATSNTTTMPGGAHEVAVHYVPSASAVVLINEVFGGTPDYVELYNAGSAAVNLAGWVLETTGCGSTAVSQHVLPAFTLAPGAYVHVVENSGTDTSDTFYLNSNICWNPDEAGSAALVDSVAGVDFVRWGGSTAPPPQGTSWIGDSAVAATGVSVLGRSNSSRDTDTPADWCEQASSAPGVNVGCPGLIFSDGFESGDRSAWTTSVPIAP